MHTVFGEKRSEEGKQVRERFGIFDAEISDGIQDIKDIAVYNWKKEYKEKFLLSRDDYKKGRLKDGKRRGLERGFCFVLA